MMTLITGFSGPPTIYFKFITKYDKCYYKVRQLFLLQSAKVCYYKVRQLFYYKVRKAWLQSATSVITKCDRYYKVWQFYHKVRQVLQSATIITKCDSMVGGQVNPETIKLNVLAKPLLRNVNRPLPPGWRASNKQTRPRVLVLANFITSVAPCTITWHWSHRS